MERYLKIFKNELTGNLSYFLRQRFAEIYQTIVQMDADIKAFRLEVVPLVQNIQISLNQFFSNQTYRLKICKKLREYKNLLQ
jgi:hypothetical protein